MVYSLHIKRSQKYTMQKRPVFKIISLLILITFISTQASFGEVCQGRFYDALATNPELHGPEQGEVLAHFVSRTIKELREKSIPPAQICTALRQRLGPLGERVDQIRYNEPTSTFKIVLKDGIGFFVGPNNQFIFEHPAYNMGAGEHIIAHQVTQDEQIAAAEHIDLDERTRVAIGEVAGELFYTDSPDLYTVVEELLDRKQEAHPDISFIHYVRGIEGFDGHPGKQGIYIDSRYMDPTYNDNQGRGLKGILRHEILSYLFPYSHEEILAIEQELDKDPQERSATILARLKVNNIKLVEARESGETRDVAYEVRSAVNEDEAIIRELDRARVLLEQGKYKEAEGLLRPILEAHPNHVLVLSRLAAALVKQTKYKEAEELLRTAISLEHKNANLLISLAAVLCSLQKLGEAKQLVTEALTLDPQNKAGKHVLGLIAVRKALMYGQVQEETTGTETSEPDVPLAAVADFKRACTLLEQRQYEEAEKVLRELVHTNPKNVNVLSRLAIALYRQGQCKAAEPFLIRALYIEPENPRLWIQLAAVVGGSVFTTKEDSEDARRFLAKAVELDPTLNYLNLLAMLIEMDEKPEGKPPKPPSDLGYDPYYSPYEPGSPAIFAHLTDDGKGVNELGDELFLKKQTSRAFSTIIRDLNILADAGLAEKKGKGREAQFKRTQAVSKDRLELAERYLNYLFAESSGNVTRYTRGEGREVLTAALNQNFVQTKEVTQESARQAYDQDAQLTVDMTKYLPKGATFTVTISRKSLERNMSIDNADKIIENLKEQARIIEKERGIHIEIKVDDEASFAPAIVFDCRIDGRITSTWLDIHSHETALDRTNALFNLGLAASSIPEDLEDRTQYEALIAYLNQQFQSLDLVGSELIKAHMTPRQITEILHNNAISIVLPPAQKPEDLKRDLELELQADALRQKFA